MTTTQTPVYNSHWDRLYHALATHPLLNTTPIESTRTITLTASVASWYNLTADGDFSESDALHTYLLDSILASEGNCVSIRVSELEARHILAQARECGLSIERSAS